jgi:hypothetical protein
MKKLLLIIPAVIGMLFVPVAKADEHIQLLNPENGETYEQIETVTVNISNPAESEVRVRWGTTSGGDYPNQQIFSGLPQGNNVLTLTEPINDAGTWYLKAELSNKAGDTGEVSFTLTGGPALPAEIITTIPRFRPNEPDFFTVRTIPNDFEGEIVRAYFDIPSGATIEYEEGGVWYEITDVFGPETGYPMLDITTTFRGIFDDVGTYSTDVEIRRLSDQEVLASTEISAVVTLQGGLFETPSGGEALMLGYVGQVMTDGWGIIVIAVGIPLAFYVIQRFSKFTPKNKAKYIK